jgi:hypothetical protein
MRNPLRSEAEAFRFLIVVLVGAVIVGVAGYINTWVGVAAAVLVIAGIAAWLTGRPSESDSAQRLVSATPGKAHRVLLVAAAGTATIAGRIGGQTTDVLVVVPALVSTVKALTGDVDDERAQAQQTADSLAAELSAAGVPARGLVGADDTILAIEDALRQYGADEIVLATADDESLAKVRERFAVPVSALYNSVR